MKSGTTGDGGGGRKAASRLLPEHTGGALDVSGAALPRRDLGCKGEIDRCWRKCLGWVRGLPGATQLSELELKFPGMCNAQQPPVHGRLFFSLITPRVSYFLFAVTKALQEWFLFIHSLRIPCVMAGQQSDVMSMEWQAAGAGSRCSGCICRQEALIMAMPSSLSPSGLEPLGTVPPTASVGLPPQLTQCNSSTDAPEVSLLCGPGSCQVDSQY